MSLNHNRIIVISILICIVYFLLLTIFITPPQYSDKIVAINGDPPFHVKLINGTILPIPINHTITNRCGMIWAMQDNHIVNYSDFDKTTSLSWDGNWRGDYAC